MSYSPEFTITPTLVSQVEAIAALRERIQSAAVEVPWVPALQKDTRARNAHSSTAIEGNPLTLEQVRAVESGRELPGTAGRHQREVVNYFGALRYIETHNPRKLKHDDIFKLHRIVAEGVMDQGLAGQYRTVAVRVGSFVPPPAREVSGLMFELLGWWNDKARGLSPVISSAIVHYRFEAIHPFADGNGRTGRALALWELYRRGFDSHHIFSIDEYYWENRSRYYSSLRMVRTSGEDLTSWLEYTAQGIAQTLERVWKRIQLLSAESKGKRLVLRPRQEELLRLLRERGSMSPREIWTALGVSKQGAMDLMRPLLDAGLIRRVGTLKSGRYELA